MTIDQIQQQVNNDPYLAVIAWRGKTRMNHMLQCLVLTWELRDPNRGWVAPAQINAKYLERMNKEAYMNSVLHLLEESSVFAVNDAHDDWEYGSPADCIEWMCRQLEIAL